LQAIQIETTGKKAIMKNARYRHHARELFPGARFRADPGIPPPSYLGG
jgi:hypothetical protein